MIEDDALNAWFCREVLPLERGLLAFIGRNWRSSQDVTDIRQEIYERVLIGASEVLPTNVGGYVFTTARNHLINRAKRERIVSFDVVADLDDIGRDVDMFATERHLRARDDLRRTQLGLDALPTRCREVVLLRKVEGLSTKEAADRLGVSTHTIERQLTLGMRALVDFMLGGSGKIDREKANSSERRKYEP